MSAAYLAPSPAIDASLSVARAPVRCKERRGAFVRGHRKYRRFGRVASPQADQAVSKGLVCSSQRDIQAAGQVTAPEDSCQPWRQSVPRAPAVPPAPRRRLPAVEQSGGRIPAKPARLVRPRRAPAAICGATAQLAA
eukprot:scaffold3423_cov72-Phaeocystis_antarctica.AAC.4